MSINTLFHEIKEVQHQIELDREQSIRTRRFLEEMSEDDLNWLADPHSLGPAWDDS